MSSEKQCHFPVFKSTEKLLFVSLWKGQSPVMWPLTILAFLMYALYSPHLYFPMFMIDHGFERDFGIEAGHIAMDQCDRVVLSAPLCNAVKMPVDSAEYFLYRQSPRP